MDSESEKTTPPQPPEKPVENRRLKRLPKTITEPLPEPPAALDHPSEPETPSPAPVKILDNRLDDQDVRITLAVQINGRAEVIIDQLITELVMHNALLSANRAQIVQMLRRVFDDACQATVTKFNLKVPKTLPEDTKTTVLQKQPLFQGDIPLFKSETLPPLHVDPDPGMRGNDQN